MKKWVCKGATVACFDHVNILTCCIKTVCELVAQHVTNGTITQGPETRE